MERASRVILRLPNDATTQLRQIYDVLSQDQIAQRKKGVANAIRLAHSDTNARTTVIEWLRAIAELDPMMTVREAAQSGLAGLERDAEHLATTTDRLSSPAQHSFVARCRNGHDSRHDRREVCRGTGMFYRGAEHGPLDRVHLVCPACAEEMIVTIDCEGYR